jgi:hypothetical protein
MARPVLEILSASGPELIPFLLQFTGFYGNPEGGRIAPIWTCFPGKYNIAKELPKHPSKPISANLQNTERCIYSPFKALPAGITMEKEQQEEKILSHPQPLSPNQRHAVLSDKRHIRIIAGAGAGKTGQTAIQHHPGYPRDPALSVRTR